MELVFIGRRVNATGTRLVQCWVEKEQPDNMLAFRRVLAPGLAIGGIAEMSAIETEKGRHFRFERTVGVWSDENDVAHWAREDEVASTELSIRRRSREGQNRVTLERQLRDITFEYARAGRIRRRALLAAVIETITGGRA